MSILLEAGGPGKQVREHSWGPHPSSDLQVHFLTGDSWTALDTGIASGPKQGGSVQVPLDLLTSLVTGLGRVIISKDDPTDPSVWESALDSPGAPILLLLFLSYCVRLHYPWLSLVKHRKTVFQGPCQKALETCLSELIHTYSQNYVLLSVTESRTAQEFISCARLSRYHWLR